MNYDEARQLKDGGWHWTTMRDGLVRTAAPCHRYIGPPFDMTKPLPPYDESQWETCAPHATKEEAERHFYDYSLAQMKECDVLNWQDCAVCGAPTKSGYGDATLSLGLGYVMLCDEHRTREQLSALHPFAPGIALVHS